MCPLSWGRAAEEGVRLLQELPVCVCSCVLRSLLLCSGSSRDEGASWELSCAVITYVKEEIKGSFFPFLRDPVEKEVQYSVLNVIIGQGRGISSDQLSFLVKNSLSFINKLRCFFTKITVYIPTLSLPLETMFLLALLLVQVVVIKVRIQSDDQ